MTYTFNTTQLILTQCFCLSHLSEHIYPQSFLCLKCTLLMTNLSILSMLKIIVSKIIYLLFRLDHQNMIGLHHYNKCFPSGSLVSSVIFVQWFLCFFFSVSVISSLNTERSFPIRFLPGHDAFFT